MLRTLYHHGLRKYGIKQDYIKDYIAKHICKQSSKKSKNFVDKSPRDLLAA